MSARPPSIGKTPKGEAPEPASKPIGKIWERLPALLVGFGMAGILGGYLAFKFGLVTLDPKLAVLIGGCVGGAIGIVVVVLIIRIRGD